MCITGRLDQRCSGRQCTGRKGGWRRYVGPVQGLSVQLKAGVWHAQEVNVPQIFLNTDTPSVEVECQVAEEMNQPHLILRFPVKTLSPLPFVVPHQGEDIRHHHMCLQP